MSLRKLRIKCLENDAFGLYSVVANPRDVSPQDVKTATQNTALEFEGKKPARDIVSLVNYVLSGYFEYAHRTGLYNRQRELWESIARTTSCKVEIVRQGVLIPIKLPVLDLYFYNSQNVPLILVRLVKPQRRKDFDKRCERYLSSFIQKVTKFQTRKGTLTGAMICFPDPVGANVIAKVQNKLGANDPANRFDSRLPPTNIPFDVVAMDFGDAQADSLAAETNGADATTSESQNFRLLYPEEKLFPVSMVHPNLAAKR